MPIPELLSAQRDFSAGELDPEMKRRDDLAVHRAGGRQMRDLRILNTGAAKQRPGRRARYLNPSRVDQVDVSPTLTYDLCFGADGTFVVRDANATAVLTGAGFTWTLDTIDQIVWTKVKVGAAQTDIVITFTGIRPFIASFDGVATWTLGDFSFATDGVGVALVPYFRVAAPGATMTPSAIGAAGDAISIAFSADVLNASHVDTLFRLAGRRMTIDTVVDAQNANVTCVDALFRQQVLAIAKPDGAVGGTGVEGFSLGQVVSGSLSSSTGEVIDVDIAGNQITVQITNYASGFIASDVGPPVILELVIGPSGRSKVTAVADLGTPIGAISWDEQLISDARGWPQSCNSDDARLILCDISGTPEAIIWSVTGQPYNLNVGANATDAIVELIAGKPRVYHVGPWTDEIVFTNKGVYYIPINQTSPLRPGSVAFLPVSPEAASSVKPVFTSDGYLYVNAGRNRVMAVIGSGAAFSSRPYTVSDVSKYHTHLFSGGPKTIAIATGDGEFPERYAYVTNADGTVVVGIFDPAQQWVGWVPWAGEASVSWLSALYSAVTFVSVYPVPGVPVGVSVVEMLDESCYLDGAVFINATPVGIPPPVGAGPFWWSKLATVELMDGLKPLGPHAIDGNGFVVPAFQGENLDIPTIMGGRLYTPFFEPFVPGGQPGQDQKQRTLRRSLGRLVVTVKDSTGFVMASLYSGPYGPQLPAQGAVQKFFRIPPWNDSEDQSQQPVPREDTYRQRFSGRNFDQRVGVFKDTPGTLTVVEVAIEASV